MGVINVPGAYSGKTYRLGYDGEAPTAEETARGQAFVESQEAQFRADYEAKYGVEDYDDGTAFGRAWDRAKTGAYGRFGTLLRSTGEQADFDWLDNMGTGMEARAREEQLMEAGRLTPATSRQDVDGIASTLTYLGELAGGSAVDTAAGLVGTIGGGIAGGMVGGPAGALAGGLAGGTAMVAPLFAGGNIQLQEEVLRRPLEPGEYGKALGTAVAQGALNAVADKVFLALRPLGFKVPTARNLFLRTGQFAAGSGVTEGVTEAGQQLMERAQAGLPIGNDEAIAQYVDAFVGGATLGGLGGAVRAPFNKPVVNATAPPTTPTTPTTPPGDPILALPAPELVPTRRGRGAVWDSRTGAGLSPTTAAEADETLDVLGVRDDDPIRGRVRAAFESGDVVNRPTSLLANLAEYANRTDDPVSRDNAKRFVTFTLNGVPSLPERLALPSPGGNDTINGALPSGPSAVPPVQSRQIGTRGDNLPGLRPTAAATVNKGALEAVKDTYLSVKGAMEQGGAETVNAPQLMKMLGITNHEAGKILQGLAKVGLVSKPGVRGARTLNPWTGDFEVSAADGDITTTMGTEEATEADPEVVPEVAPEPEVVPEATAEPEVVPEVAPEPETEEVTFYDMETPIDRAAGIKVPRRPIVIKDVNGVKVPFYVSTGAGGKTDVAPGKWYPFFGITPQGWLVKTSGEDINSYYGSEALRETAEELDRTLGDVREDADKGRVVTSRVDDAAFLSAINQDMHPDTSLSTKALRAAPEGERVHPYDSAGTRRAIDSVLSRIDPSKAEPEVVADTDPVGLEGNQGQDNGRARPMGRNDSPGGVGREGAAEPRGIPGVPYEPRTAPPPTSDARRAEALRKVLARNLTDRHAKRSANWPQEARSNYEESVGGARLDMEDRRGSEPLTSGDYEAITALVNSKGTEEAKQFAEPAELSALDAESAARNFFKLFPDPLDGLEMIASNWDTTFSANAGPMYEGLSSPKAREAAAWVNDNLSAGANNFLNGRLEFYGDTTSREEIDAAGIPARIKALEEAKQFAEPAELSALDAEIDGLQKQLNQRKYAADRKGVDDTAEQIAKDKAKYGRKSAYVSLRSPLHPFVRAHLRAGNLKGALEAMGNTARSPRMRKLANRLATYTGSTSVELVEDTDPRLRRGLTNKYAYGAFIPSENAILIAKRATAYESVLLHEAVHMATEAELNNEASPVRRRLANIMQKTAEIHGEEDIPGSLTDVHEFVAEFMSNGEFQEVMDQMQSRGDEVSLFTRTKRVLENFIRRLMGMQPRKYATPETGVEPTDDIRTLVDGILSAAPVGGELNTATPRFFEMSTPEGARRMLKSMHEAAPEGARNLYNDTKLAMAQTELPGRVGNIWRGLVVPLKNLTVYAKPIIPMAGAAWDVVTGHHATLSQRNDVLRRMTADVMTLLKSDIDVVKEFNQLATRASLLGIDPQISVADARNMFDKFSFKYKTDTAGVRSDWKYEYFDGATERDARKDAYNAALPADGLKSLRARKGRDASPSDMAEFTALKRMYDALTPEAKAAYKKTLAYYAYLHEETRRVMKARIESMSKGNVALHRALYDDMYDRIFNEQSITAYVPLMREGNYWITFSAKDPQSGNIELYKTSYKSDMERQTAIKELEAHRAANPGDGITPDISEIEEYTTTRADPRTNGTVPLSFMQDMRDVLKKDMDAAVAADPTKAADAETRRDTLEKELVALALELTPERSFLQAYKAREGARGAIGDRGPLEERNLSARDTVDRMLRKGGLLSRQLANVEYRSRAQEVAEEMRGYINDQKALKGADKVPLKKTEKMDAYYAAIVPSLENISIERAAWSRGANTAAYAWTLALNPSSAFMNLTSIPVFVMPYLGARHGYSRSYKALNHATKVLGASGRKRMVDYIKDDGTIGQRPDDVKLGGNSIANYTLGAFDESSNYAAGDNRLNNLGPLVQALRTAGMLDDSLAYDITEANDISHAGRLQRASRVGAWMMHTTENISRELTAITAYNLILQDMAGGKRARADGTSSISDKLTPADLEAAANQAAEDTELTNGTIPAAGAPRLGVGNVASPLYMFKRHPLAMLNLIATTFKDSFLSKERLAELAETYGVDSAEYKNEAEVQRTAKLQFVSILGHLGLVSGVAGIPLISGIAAIASAIFLDDDDPTFMEMFRMSNPLGELGYYGLGNYITGGAMSGRIGLGGAIYQPPLGVEDQSPFWTAMEGLAGPVVGLPIGIQRRAARLFERGEPWRAWEAIAPSVVRNQMRAYRYAKAGGAESTRGDMIAEFGIGRSILQALGLSPADFIQKTEANSTGKRIEQSIIAARTEILRQGNVARRTGNAAEAANLRQARREFNAEYPEYKITADTLDSSWGNFKRTSKQMVNGVQFNPKLRGRIDDLTASLRDNPATLWDALGVG